MSFDEIFDLTAGVCFHFYNIYLYIYIYVCTTFGSFVFSPGVILSVRVTEAYPVTTDLIVQVNGRTTTKTTAAGDQQFTRVERGTRWEVDQYTAIESNTIDRHFDTIVVWHGMDHGIASKTFPESNFNAGESTKRSIEL